MRPFPARLPPAWAGIAFTGALAWIAWPLVGKDVPDHLLPSFEHIRVAGPVRAFAAPFSDDTPPYLYLLAAATLFADWLPAPALIKLVAIGGAAALASACRSLLRASNAMEPGRGAALTLATPSLIVNAAVLSQYDAIWTSLCVMALASACRGRHRAMLAWLGAALAFKLQAVFLAPFVLGLLIRRGVAMRWWPIAPGVFAAMMLPAWAAGFPALDLATVYLRQSGEYPLLAYNAPNLWAIVDQLSDGYDQALVGLALAGAVGAAAAIAAWTTTRPTTPRALIEGALLSALIIPGLLPHMHERYFFLADILSLMMALVARDRWSWTVAALVQAGSLLALFAYVSGASAPRPIAALCMMLATVKLARALLRPVANDNPAQPLAFMGSCPQFISE